MGEVHFMTLLETEPLTTLLFLNIAFIGAAFPERSAPVPLIFSIGNDFMVLDIIDKVIK